MERIDASLGLFLMTSKGFAVLKRLLQEFGKEKIAFAVVARDGGVQHDAFEETCEVARVAGIPVYAKDATNRPNARFLLAVSWRWLIRPGCGEELVVFHDSLLPRYRGFAPLVSALINGDRVIGVTALRASDEYDRGPIIDQESIEIDYPLTISEAIHKVVPCYEKLAVDVVGKLVQGHIPCAPQDESLATYSLWRDDDDYFVDWSWSAARIRRFVDAVGYPYKGAAVTVDGVLCRIGECVEVQDVVIANRTAGKVIFSVEGDPVVVCGRGLLRILRLTEDASGSDLLPLGRFRTRFGGKSCGRHGV